MKIFGYDKYQILEDGTVIGARGKKLKVDLNSCGYERVTLCRDGKVNRCFVHTLVAMHFVDFVSMKHRVVNHVDGNKRNNHKDNLEWVTPSENVLDGWRRGRVSYNKYSDYKIQQIRLMYNNGYSIKAIQKRWGGDRGTISKYVTGG